MSDINEPNVIVENAYEQGGSSASDFLAGAFDEKQVAEAQEVEEQQTAAESTEEPKVEESESKEQDDQFAAKFAALSRKEKAMREREAQLEARMKEIEERSATLEQEYEEKYGKYKDYPEKLKNKPLEALAEEGVDFDTLLKMVLENNGEPTTEMQIQRLRDEMQNKYMKELENLKTELADKEKAAEEKRYQEVIEDYKYELNEFIETNGEKYELIKLNEASDLVYQVVEEHYNENNRILSHEEACEHVENYLLEEAKKHLSVNKIKQLFGPEAAAEKAKETQKPGVKTLTNAEAATVPTTGSNFMSDDDSKREAAKLIRWVED